MTSGKQKREKLKKDRKTKAAAKAERLKQELTAIRARYISDAVLADAVPVKPELCAPPYPYSAPDFMRRGTYLDMHFVCKDCGKDDIWSATQQKWWYETANGDIYSVAVRCRPCRKAERARKAQARRVHLEGIEKKRQTLAKS